MDVVIEPLSKRSWEAAVRDINEFCESLADRLDRVCEEVAQTCYDHAVVNCEDYGIDITRERHADGHYVTATGYEKTDGRGNTWYYSPAFLEFGTGVRNAGSYPYEVPSWYRYGAGSGLASPRSHRGAAWYYWGSAGKGVKTYGDPAAPFMAPAAEAARQEIRNIVKEVFE